MFSINEQQELLVMMGCAYSDDVLPELREPETKSAGAVQKPLSSTGSLISLVSYYDPGVAADDRPQPLVYITKCSWSNAGQDTPVADE